MFRLDRTCSPATRCVHLLRHQFRVQLKQTLPVPVAVDRPRPFLRGGQQDKNDLAVIETVPIAMQYKGSVPYNRRRLEHRASPTPLFWEGDRLPKFSKAQHIVIETFGYLDRFYP